MKNTFKKIVCSYYFPFFLFTVAMAIFHLSINVITADDLIFKTYLDQFELREFLKLRYKTWSSRIVIEAVLVNISRVHWFWKILDTLMFAWMPLALSLLFNPQKNKLLAWGIVLIFAFFPYETLTSAGWMATTLNYLWPLAFGLLAIMPLRNSLYQKRTPWYLYIISVIALAYASNQEQMCAIVIAIDVVLGGYLIFRDNKIPWFAIIQLLLSLGSIIFILSCPGNDNRNLAEMNTWFPQFADISFLQKIELGYMHTMHAFFIQVNRLFVVFCVLLVGAVFLCQKKVVYRCIAAFPLITVLTMNQVFFRYNYLNNAFYQAEDLSFDFDNIIVKVVLIITTIAAICIIISLISVFGKSIKTLLSLFVLGIGFASSVVLGFSPTVWASSYRIFLFIYVAFIAASIMLFIQIYEVIKVIHVNNQNKNIR